MSAADRSAVDTNQLRDQLLRWLATDAGLRPGELVTGAVLVFCTELMQAGGDVDYNDGRAYPLGEISPTVELGLIQKAWGDTRRGK